MLLKDEIDADLGEMAREMRTTRAGSAQMFTFYGVAVACIPTSLTAGLEIDLDGNALTAGFKLIVQRSAFASALTADTTLVTADADVYTADASGARRPVAGRVVTFREQEYRIQTAREAGPQSHLEFTLIRADSNQ